MTSGSKLCVGAASRRIVEEAAKLQVHQIVASRRQVADPTGYIGLSPDTLVTLVRDLSDGKTQVVRDHGGPKQGGFDDDGIAAFDVDVKAGFHGLHIDVCKLPRIEQAERLVALCKRYEQVNIEIGGEHELPLWNTELLSTVLKAGVNPDYVVIGAGTYVWADRQIGFVHDGRTLQDALNYARGYDVKTKAHNMDWVGSRLDSVKMFDAYNLAPELGQVEVRAILTMLPPASAVMLLDYAYQSKTWRRWFGPDEGTYGERAECAIRYMLNDYNVIGIIGDAWTDDCERFVRRCIRDIIVYG